VEDNVEFESEPREGDEWDSGQHYEPESQDEYSTELPVEDTFSERQEAVMQETAPPKADSALDKFLDQFVAAINQIPVEAEAQMRRFKFAGGRELTLPLDESDILNKPKEFVEEKFEEMRMAQHRDGVHRR
jgi:hypothetical protein